MFKQAFIRDAARIGLRTPLLTRANLSLIASIIITCLLVTTSQAYAAPLPAGGHVRPIRHNIWLGSGAVYFSMHTRNASRVHVLDIDLPSGNWVLKPVHNSSLTSVPHCAIQYEANAAINGGFFDLKSGLPTGYVIIDGKTVASPRITNSSMAAFGRALCNRTELRILRHDQGAISAQITQHNQPLPPGTRLLHALQSGPQLLPGVTTREEAFIRPLGPKKNSDSIDSTSPEARTAAGITADGHLLLVCVCGRRQDPHSPGLSMNHLSMLMQQLGCVTAMNLDGGTSTTMFVHPAQPSGQSKMPRGVVVCASSPPRRVSTVLLLEHVCKSPCQHLVKSQNQ